MPPSPAEEKARNVAVETLKRWVDGYTFYPDGRIRCVIGEEGFEGAELLKGIEQALLTATQEATEIERERCAKLVERIETFLPNRVRNASYFRGEIAQKIREGGA